MTRALGNSQMGCFSPVLGMGGPSTMKPDPLSRISLTLASYHTLRCRYIYKTRRIYLSTPSNRCRVSKVGYSFNALTSQSGLLRSKWRTRVRKRLDPHPSSSLGHRVPLQCACFRVLYKSVASQDSKVVRRSMSKDLRQTPAHYSVLHAQVI